MPKPLTKDTKARLHPRNRNRERYDLVALVDAVPALKAFIVPNKRGEDSVDFSKPAAVKLLNKALLFHYYKLAYWEFPDHHLCPPIPSRADYIHYLADLLAEKNYGKIPTGDAVKCLDIGTGASCIYPLLGTIEYGWQFVASDIDEQSLATAEKIVQHNPTATDLIACRHQPDRNVIFHNIIQRGERYHLTLCNPPFHASIADARQSAQRKVKNLTGQHKAKPTLNFAGNKNELIYPGGERQFIQTMARESRDFAQSVQWFSTLVSKQSNLKVIYQTLEKMKAKQVRTIPMGTGNKVTRVVAWSFN